MGNMLVQGKTMTEDAKMISDLEIVQKETLTEEISPMILKKIRPLVNSFITAHLWDQLRRIVPSILSKPGHWLSSWLKKAMNAWFAVSGYDRHSRCGVVKIVIICFISDASESGLALKLIINHLGQTVGLGADFFRGYKPRVEFQPSWPYANHGTGLPKCLQLGNAHLPRLWHA